MRVARTTSVIRDFQWLASSLRWGLLLNGYRQLAGWTDTHLVGAPGEPAWYTDAFFTIGNDTAMAGRSVGFTRDKAGWVHLQGVILQSVVGGSLPSPRLFTLPDGYRPDAEVRFEVLDRLWSVTNNWVGMSDVSVRTNGEVYSAKGGDASFCLDGLRFHAPQAPA